MLCGRREGASVLGSRNVNCESKAKEMARLSAPRSCRFSLSTCRGRSLGAVFWTSRTASDHNQGIQVEVEWLKQGEVGQVGAEQVRCLSRGHQLSCPLCALRFALSLSRSRPAKAPPNMHRRTLGPAR